MVLRLSLLAAVALVLSMVSAGRPAWSAEGVTFRRHPVEAGEASMQEILFQLDLEMSIRQSDQVVGTRHQDYQKRQRRRMQIVKAEGNRPVEGIVRYEVAESVVSDQETPAQHQPHPVQGKAYRLHRAGQQLQVTTLDGKAPPDDELAQVQHDMQRFGLENPLADFFAGKQIAVGQVIQLPTELAEELLGPEEQMGRVERFHMRLDAVRSAGGRQVAEFATAIAIQPVDANGLDVQVQGRVGLEADGCRLVLMNLSGPVQIAETYGPEGGQYTVVTSGNMTMQARVTPVAETAAAAPGARR